MNKPFEFNEAANSPDLSDAEVLGAIATSRAEDIVPHLAGQVCSQCGRAMMVSTHEKRFRYPHFYWRSKLCCSADHVDQRVFQVTWLYERQHIPR